ncbi:OsmC family peroxiredoxin [Pseudoxanthomonas gei]|uniref:OsmC family peroxiredoxin n=1 Tax=Pseudoxanthomonas gei TaxID=1383030 RepID=A0ABX0AE51_9GAMM|nr:OsmC family protein [Pseudoxanthomonas gei]NDK39872.1 OsmC family peroxiredoxin [Pseudoxanthomonas gei]
MSEHKTSIQWNRDGKPFTPEGYSRDHEWVFERGQRLTGSAAPAYLGSAQGVDPEEALVVALSSCHMLTLLAIASKKGWVIDSYADEAVGRLGKNEAGRIALVGVTLRPKIVFAEGSAPDAEGLQRLHHSAHQNCFIANSVKTEVTIEPR